MESKLTVRNLRISFKVNDGLVRAIRGIDFDLYKGETLAIVGESGSGKSVTSKAVLGILAGNSIVESGRIIYDGKDLLKISEDDFHKIRGDKIAMIFQDPMSSLNPIVRIGRQLTEAMLLKGKARQRESRINFNTHLKLLKKNMVSALAENDVEKAKKIEEKCANFDKFEYKHLELEGAFLNAKESAIEAINELDALIFEIEKNAAKDVSYRLRKIKSLSLAAIHEYVVKNDADKITDNCKKIDELYQNCKATKEYSVLNDSLSQIAQILKPAVELPVPNFFAMGYYLTFSTEPLPNMPVDELNSFLRDYLDKSFMLDFINDAKEGVKYSANQAYDAKRKAIEAVDKYRSAFDVEFLNEKECYDACASLTRLVDDAIDKLEIVKDGRTYTFGSSLKSELDKYFEAITKNAKEEKRFAKQQAKYDSLVKRGKTPDWKVVPLALTDLNVVKENILYIVDFIKEHFENLISAGSSRDYDAETIAIINYLKDNASGVVNKITPLMAKNRAIKLMEEVGIPEPRKRYYQYPFEFSGGMRQRIVIAIALAADPDILICDEPTTALDVTIQSQILELINKLKVERNLSVIFITHDLGVVANMADRIAVMYAGKIVEYGTAEDVFYEPAHPYTWALLSSMPDLNTKDKLDAIPGTPPNMIYPPVGDAFAARNKYALKIDFEQQPPMFKISETHSAATWLLHPDAPKVDPPKIVVDRIARMKEQGANNYVEQ